jgi:AraC-like DNA-binding protein
MDFVTFHRRMLAPWNSVDTRLQIWIQSNPNRAATHEEIAEEIGASRETVSRKIEQAFIDYHRDGRSV